MNGTVGDFSRQWTRYADHGGYFTGYFASAELLDDVLGPFLSLEALRGLDVAEIGCGNGRFIKLLAPVCRRVVAVEPSEGIHNAMRACAGHPNIDWRKQDVYALGAIEPLDAVLSIGVVHHTEDPLRALSVMRGLLKPGGKCLIWVYGREGNELYLATFGRLRALTQRLPDAALHGAATALTPALWAYSQACRALPLPMRAYMRAVVGRFDWQALRLNIYDQLNPSIARYYRRAEVEQLMKDAGFVDVALHHRHGYSWTAIGARG